MPHGRRSRMASWRQRASRSSDEGWTRHVCARAVCLPSSCPECFVSLRDGEFVSVRSGAGADATRRRPRRDGHADPAAARPVATSRRGDFGVFDL